jgi:hypothetical protein
VQHVRVRGERKWMRLKALFGERIVDRAKSPLVPTTICDPAANSVASVSECAASENAVGNRHSRLTTIEKATVAVSPAVHRSGAPPSGGNSDPGDGVPGGRRSVMLSRPQYIPQGSSGLQWPGARHGLYLVHSPRSDLPLMFQVRSFGSFSVGSINDSQPTELLL